MREKIWCEGRGHDGETNTGVWAGRVKAVRSAQTRKK